MKINKLLAVSLTSMLILTGCGTIDSSSSGAKNGASSSASASEAENGEMTTISYEEAKESFKFGEDSFVITLYPEYAPITCENFEKLVSSGFYDGITFHRIVDGFMAQGGDPQGTGAGGSKETIKGEFSANGVDNQLSHKRGIVSMARSQNPNSASSQFFICYDDSCTFLDGNYAAFGEVTEGMNVVDDFLKVQRDYNSMGELASPVTPVVIEDAELLEPDENGNPRAAFRMNNFLG